jgi:TolA-binding protein
MKRRLCRISAFVALVLTAFPPLPAFAIDEPERLWLVGERAFADGLYPVARRALERFVSSYPRDQRAGDGLLMLGKARLTLGDLPGALDAFQRAGSTTPRPGRGLETRFWEAETLFRLKRFIDARAAYDEVLRSDASAVFAPDALYGFGWSELELRRPEPAIRAFRDFLQTWSDHPLAPSATFYIGRALVELKRYAEALPILADFPKRYPGHKLIDDARYLHAAARLESGDVKGGRAEMRAFVDAHPGHPLAAEGRKALRQTVAKTTPTQMQEEYAALMSQVPATPEALVEALALAQRGGRPSDQDAAWRKLRANFPRHPLTHRTAFELANAAFERKQWKDAVSYAEIAIGGDDDGMRAESWLLTGESELKLKRFAAAAKAFEEVGTVDTADAAVRYRALAGLGLAREEQKELRAALKAYETVATKSPDGALRQWAKQRADIVKAQLAKPATPATPAPKPKGKS